jgi:Gas vesicle synthesis protein GvpL/GvpF
MEIRIGTNASAKPEAESGAAYLRARAAEQKALDAVARQAHDALADVVREWCERQTAAGRRIFALVPRAAIADFQHRAAALECPSGARVLVSGPWPATEFAELNESS